jgi:predicted ArsR family transcriptional regulator
LNAGLFQHQRDRQIALKKAFGTVPKTSSSRRRSSTTRINVETLTQAITSKSVGTRLTIAGVADELGGSTQTIRKVLDQLAEIGTLKVLGPDPNHSGQGRAPHVWEKA